MENREWRTGNSEPTNGTPGPLARSPFPVSRSRFSIFFLVTARTFLGGTLRRIRASPDGRVSVGALAPAGGVALARAVCAPDAVPALAAGCVPDAAAAPAVAGEPDAATASVAVSAQPPDGAPAD